MKNIKKVQRQRLNVSDKIRQFAGSLNMEIPDNWKPEKDDQLARKYL